MNNHGHDFGTSTAAFLLMAAALASGIDTLSLQGYTKQALKYNPQIGIAQSSVDAAQAGKKSALSSLFPHLDAQGAETHSETKATSPRSSLNGNSTNASAGLELKQLLFDFGKSTAEVGASSRTLVAAQADQEGSTQDVILNACSAYFSYLLALKVLEANQEALKQSEIHLEQAKRLFEIGKQPQFAITKAEVDVANANVVYIKAENGLSLARVQLENVAGVQFKDSLVLSDSLNVVEAELALDSALKIAMDKRPEIISSRAKTEAARLQWLSTKRAMYPDLNASGSLGWQNPDNTQWTRDWSVGVSITAPIFQGGGLAAGADQANANFIKMGKTLESTIQSISLEVQQRYLDKKAAYQQIAATSKLVEQAQQGLRLSQERYRIGAATSVEITDAEQTLLNAVISRAQAWFDYRIAHTRLLRAMGALYDS